MNLQKFVDQLFEHIKSASGRDLTRTVLDIAPEAFFPVEPPESAYGQLEKAAVAIGESLADTEAGDDAITTVELADAVHTYHEQSGTSWCPPVEAALREAAKADDSVAPSDEAE